MKWNAKDTVCYLGGRNPIKFGDEITPEMAAEMGEETVKERVENGIIIDDAKAEDEAREALFSELKELGLKPHHNAGIDKLRQMKQDYEDLQELKKEALALGIDPADDVTYPELKILVDAKKQADDEDGE